MTEKRINFKQVEMKDKVSEPQQEGETKPINCRRSRTKIHEGRKGGSRRRSRPKE
jgi:hypothetical protein